VAEVRGEEMKLGKIILRWIDYVACAMLLSCIFFCVWGLFCLVSKPIDVALSMIFKAIPKDFHQLWTDSASRWLIILFLVSVGWLVLRAKNRKPN
jgi:hypothetical protein